MTPMTVRTYAPSLPLALVVALALAGCDDDGAAGPAADPPGPRAEVVAHLGDAVILPLYRELADRTAALRTTAAAWAGAPDDGARRTAAQQAWAQAIDTWQRLEVLRLGPAGDSRAPGGLGLRADVYAWPDLRLCAIDELTASDAHDDAAAIAAEPPSRRGLGALEYLLFVDGDENQCSALSAVNAEGTWAAIVTAGEVPARRAAQAAATASALADAAAGLRDRWEPTGGDFVAETRDPRRPGGVYGSAQTALNALSDAVVQYLDIEIEDLKLGSPAGLTRCDTATCPEARESRWADRSKAHLAANLAAVETVFFGGAPGGPEPGLDDVLVAIGAGDLVTSMTADLAAARQAVDAIPGTLAEALESDVDAVIAAHGAVNRVRILLETSVLSALDLDPPQDIAADND